VTAAVQDLRSTRGQALPAGPVRILHVYSGNLYGGIESFLRTLAKHKDDASVATSFALCFEGRLAAELREEGASVHILGAVRVRSPRTIVAARSALAAALRAGRHDVVVCHSSWPYALFAPVIRASGARLVFHMHDVPNALGWPDQWANRTAPDLVVCNSEFTAVSGRWFFPSAPRVVRRCPVEIDRDGRRGDRRQVRSALGTSPEAVVILQASRMQAWKGHRLLIDALSELRANPRWVCWIAGGAQRPSEVAYEQEMRARVRQFGLEGRVQFLGQRSDVPALMGAADILCQPNLGPEPFGIAFVEALAAALPVVTTAMGGAPEIVGVSCGRLVSPDARSVAAAIEELVDDAGLRQRLSDAGPGRARELCEPALCTAALARELSDLARRGRPDDVRARALYSGGHSEDAILSTVADALRERRARFDVLVDLGCGRGDCARRLDGLYDEYLGCDVVSYEAFPHSRAVRFRETDLNHAPYPLDGASASAVVSVETIEHVENPRLLMREMARIARPGGCIVVTTPNQLSLASKLHLVVKNEFLAFKEAPGLYPAHITALVEKDLSRIARECGLVDIQFRYTDRGRIPLTAASWPSWLGARGRRFSDNIVMVATRP
jgi:glycosyltransferase involved in cell wall biosynthesis/2-polyprenyl-3-methyl-5-hydroxy-6-metoxy-1,4-benzoquinol methylase